MVWPRSRSCGLAKMILQGHSKKKQQLEEVGGDNIKEWTGMDFNCQLNLNIGQLKTGQGGKGLL